MNRLDLIKTLPPNSAVIELGVCTGAFGAEIVRAGYNYIGIDCYAGDRGHDTNQYLSAEALINCARVREGQRINLLRARFDEVRAFYCSELTGRIDLVYIDGYAHTGQDGGKTIEQWMDVVKAGGILAGHDYDSNKWPETVKAVDEWAARHELTISLTDEAVEPSWYVKL